MSSDPSFGSIAVAGAGTMGAGIAITIARAGFPTLVLDQSQPALDRARLQVAEFFASSVKKA